MGASQYKYLPIMLIKKTYISEKSSNILKKNQNFIFFWEEMDNMERSEIIYHKI